MADATSDAALASAWQAGDSAAGHILFERHYGRLARFFRSKVGDGYSDLVQQSFLAIVEGRGRLRNPDDFRRYLFAIAYNLLFKHLQREYRSVTREVLATMSAADLGPSPSRVVAQRQQVHMLLHALRSLPLDQQVTFELYCWEGMTVAQIADVQGTPVGTAKTRLRQARIRLGELLRQQVAPAAMIESSVSDLDAWAKRVRDGLHIDPPPS